MQTQFTTTSHRILCGHDTIMDYVFMVIFDLNGEMVYSNLNEWDFLEKKDFNYFIDLALERFEIITPKSVIADILRSQLP